MSEGLRKLIAHPVIRWGVPLGATAFFVLLVSRKSTDPVVFGRYSGTAFFFLLAWAVLLLVLWRLGAGGARYERWVDRISSRPVLLWALLGTAGLALVGFVARWNFLTPLLTLGIATFASVQSAESPRERGSKLAKSALLSTFSLSFTLIFLEVSLRLFYPVPAGNEQQMYFEADPYTGYRHRSDSMGYFHGNIEAWSNRHGHRDQEVTKEKPEDVFRIMVLGDSFPVGYDVEEAEAFPSVLEDRLVNTFGDRVEVVNTAVSGWTPFQYAEYYVRYGHEFSPDLIVVSLYVGNDIYNPTASSAACNTAMLGRRIPRDKADRRKEAWLRIMLYEHLHLARLVMNRGRLVKPRDRTDFRREHCEDFDDFVKNLMRAEVEENCRKYVPELDAEAANTFRQVERVVNHDPSRSVPVAVVMIPVEAQMNPALRKAILAPEERTAFDFDMPQALFARVFQEKKIPFIDLLPAFRASDAECLYMNDGHWLPEGHELAADLLFEAIRSRVPAE